MQDLIAKDWGYKIVSSSTFNFHHVLLRKISLFDLARNLADFKEIRGLPDGSIEITTDSLTSTIAQIEKLVQIIEKSLSSTPDFSYALPRKNLNGWMSAVYGCVGIIIARLYFGETDKAPWGLISKVPGVYVKNYTLIFYENYSKIIHPIRSDNYNLREGIEREVASVLNTMARRINESQPGYEGKAMLSVVEEKTGLKEKEIVELINKKIFENRENQTGISPN